MWNSESKVENLLNAALDHFVPKTEGLEKFGQEIKNRNMYHEIRKTAVGLVIDFTKVGYDFDKVGETIIAGVVGKYLFDFFKANAPSGYRPHAIEEELLVAYKQLVEEVEKNTNRSRSSGSNWGSNNNSGGSWGNNNNQPSNAAPSFGNSGGGNNNRSGGDWGNNSGGSLLARATSNRETRVQPSGFSKQEQPAEPTQTKSSPAKTAVIMNMSPIPYYIFEHEVMLVTESQLSVITKAEAEKMQLDYYKHELNTAFFEAVKRNGVLRPESHFESTNTMFKALNNPIDGIAGVKLELKRLNELVESVGNDVDLKNLRAVKLGDVYESTSVSETVMEILQQLTTEGFKCKNLYAEFSINHNTTLFATNDDIDLLTKFTSVKNLAGIGAHLEEIKGKVSDKVWYTLESRLTKAISTYLCSTLPLFIKLDSFINDYNGLIEYIVKKTDEANMDAEEKLRVWNSLNGYALEVIGDFYVEEIEENRSEVIDNETDGTEEGGDRLKEVMAASADKHYMRMQNAVRENYLMVGFNAAEMRLAFPELVDSKGIPCKVQPVGGIVDKDSMSHLYKSLQMLMENYPKGITYILTNDNYRCRVSRSVFEDNWYVLDLPESI